MGEPWGSPGAIFFSLPFGFLCLSGLALSTSWLISSRSALLNVQLYPAQGAPRGSSLSLKKVHSSHNFAFAVGYLGLHLDTDQKWVLAATTRPEKMVSAHLGATFLTSSRKFCDQGFSGLLKELWARGGSSRGLAM